jgi:Leucine-rich repeat (LRR) protein
LSNNNIFSFFDDQFSGTLPNLEKLYLNSNKLEVIPEFVFTNFPKLQILEFRQNNVQTIPPEIKQLKTLTKADFSSNKIQNIPYEICELKGLQTLDLNNNPLMGIPNTLLSGPAQPILTFLKEKQQLQKKQKGGAKKK